MEYLDFSSVITTIRKFISDAHNMNQLDLMYDLFVSFLSDEKSLDIYEGFPKHYTRLTIRSQENF